MGWGCPLRGRDYRITARSAAATAAADAVRGGEHQRVEVGRAHQPALGDDVAHRAAGFFRFLGDLGGLVVADLRVQEGGERDALVDEEGAPFAVDDDALEVLFGGGVHRVGEPV